MSFVFTIQRFVCCSQPFLCFILVYVICFQIVVFCLLLFVFTVCLQYRMCLRLSLFCRQDDTQFSYTTRQGDSYIFHLALTQLSLRNIYSHIFRCALYGNKFRQGFCLFCITPIYSLSAILAVRHFPCSQLLER